MPPIGGAIILVTPMSAVSILPSIKRVFTPVLSYQKLPNSPLENHHSPLNLILIPNF